MSLPKQGGGDAPQPEDAPISRAFERDTRAKNLIIVREIYDSENAQERFESELEDALALGAETIVLEPMKLGDETARWIRVGNCLHKTAVLSGLSGIICAFAWPKRPFVYFPICTLSLAATSIYIISWQNDPCCKYQVEHEPSKLPTLRSLNIGSPIVIVKRDDTRRKYLHTVISISAVLYASWRYYYY
jgi:hypothetical protein